MLKLRAVLCILALAVLAFFSTADARFKRGSRITADYRCYNDAECIERGHSYCSFASAERRDGVNVGWCQTGNKPGGGSVIYPQPVPLPAPILDYPVTSKPYPSPDANPSWENGVAGGQCWWTGCQSTAHRDKCPAATRHVKNNFAPCQNGDVNVLCCR